MDRLSGIDDGPGAIDGGLSGIEDELGGIDDVLSGTDDGLPGIDDDLSGARNGVRAGSARRSRGVPGNGPVFR